MSVTTDELDEWDDDGRKGPSPNRLLTPEERIRRGARSKWRVDENGNDVMPPLQREYLEGYIFGDKLRGVAKAEWAREHRVSPRTIREWEKNEKFIAAWQHEAHVRRMSPEWHENIIEALAATAADRNHPQHVAAAKEVIRLLNIVQPPSLNVNVTATPSLTGVSDEELVQMAEIVVATREPSELTEAVDHG